MANDTPATTKKLVKRAFTNTDWLGRISRTSDKLLARFDKPLYTSGSITTGIRTSQYAIGQQAQMIANENKDRQRIVVKNVNSAAASVAIGDRQAVLASNGYILNQNEREEFLNTYGELWAIAATGTVNITVMEE
jgi:hypothetical protein